MLFLSFRAAVGSSLSARRAWIEISRAEMAKTSNASLSARRAWIEICCSCRFVWLLAVALRKESVDRNLYLSSFALVSLVALRKESVDRNTPAKNPMICVNESLSARRAWIEILISTRQVRLICRRSPQGERG